MSRSSHRLLAAATALVAISLSAPASAQDVQVDPNSPAGTEYDIPIDRGRREAQGGKKDDDGNADLFGEGVQNDAGTSSGSGSGADDGGKKDGGKDGKEDDAGDDAGAATTTPAAPPGATAEQVSFDPSESSSGGSGSLLAVGALTLAIVAAAAAGGWAIRRRSL